MGQSNWKASSLQWSLLLLPLLPVMPKLSECLEEAGVLVVVMIPLHLLTPAALPLCDSWGRGWGVCCPCSCLSAFHSPTANHRDHAASISLTALGDWKEVWELALANFWEEGGMGGL